jgi:organic radical activating enzyme
MKVDMDQDTVHQKQSEIDVSHEQSKTHQEPNSADETKQITLSDKPVAKWLEAAADDVVENSEKKDEELNSVTEPEEAEDENQRQCRLLQKPSEVETAEMTQALQSDQQHAMQQLQDTDQVRR